MADLFCAPGSEADLKEALSFAKENSLKTTFLSGGTNVLISDGGIRGLVIYLGNLKRIESNVQNDCLEIIAECGVPKSELLKLFLKNKLAPAMFLAGLPGDIGGGVVMNAGVAEDFKPREFVEIVEWIDVIDLNGKSNRMTKNELKWSYRHCDGWQPGVIFKIGLSWPMQQDQTVLDRVREANRVRLSKQPLDLPSGGSTFRNPLPLTAGKLIDECGLKGFKIGGAEVSRRHANFIVNTGAAKASDIDSVIRHVQAEVLRQKKIQLSTEVVYLGDWDT